MIEYRVPHSALTERTRRLHTVFNGCSSSDVGFLRAHASDYCIRDLSSFCFGRKTKGIVVIWFRIVFWWKCDVIVVCNGFVSVFVECVVSFAPVVFIWMPFGSTLLLAFILSVYACRSTGNRYRSISQTRVVCFASTCIAQWADTYSFPYQPLGLFQNVVCPISVAYVTQCPQSAQICWGQRIQCHCTKAVEWTEWQSVDSSITRGIQESSKDTSVWPLTCTTQ